MPSFIQESKILTTAQTAVKACNDIVKAVDVLMEIAKQQRDGQISQMFSELISNIEDINSNRMTQIRQIQNFK